MWLVLSAAFAATPIPVYGSLVDGQGAPLEGSHPVQVRLTADEAGSSAIGATSTVTVSFATGAFYLEHTVDEALLRGRAGMYVWISLDGAWSNPVQVRPAPFAIEAINAQNLAGEPPSAFQRVTDALSWSRLTTATMPDHVRDGYSAGTGINLTGTTLSVVPSALTPNWSSIQNRPSGLDDGDNDTTYSGSSSVTIDGARAIAVDPTWATNAAKGAAYDTQGELTTELDSIYLRKAALSVTNDGMLTLGNAGTTAGCTSTNAGQIRWNGATFQGCDGNAWQVFGGVVGDSAAFPGATCKAIKTARATAASGLYWIDPDGAGGQASLQTWCDMVTNGGGWTLAAHGHSGSVSVSASNKNIPSLKCGGGTFAPTARANTAGAINAIALARGSTEVAFAMSSGGSTVTTGDLSAYTEAHKFTIPDPAAITFENHSYVRNNSSGGACTAVSVTQIVGGSNTGARFTLRNSLGATWPDSYPTGYGAVAASNCRGFTSGPFVHSVHTGDGNSSQSGPSYSTCDISDADDQYNYQGIWTQTAVNVLGSTSIWFR